jgi:hypothetical protein
MSTPAQHPDLAEQTPAQVDTALAGHMADAASASSRITAIDVLLASHDEPSPHRSPLRPEQRETHMSRRALAVADLEAAQSLADPLHDEFDRRGRWTRYWLVTNAGGHVHSSTGCASCFPTTQFAWLTEQSGMTPHDLVELAGESACTVCFPSAPVDTLRRPSALEAPERKAARLVREAEKSQRAQVAAEKGITTSDGTPLFRTSSGRYPFNTERAATNERAQAITSLAWYSMHPEAPEWRSLIARVDAAVAAKHGRTVADVHADAMAKARAAYRREFGGAMPDIPGL